MSSFFIRYCSIINSYVKHNGNGTPVSSAAPKVNLHQNKTIPLPRADKDQHSSPNVSLPDVKGKTDGTSVFVQTTKPSADSEKHHLVPAASKLKGQNDKSSSLHSGGSIANLWGRASAKSKPDSAIANGNILVSDCKTCFHLFLW